LKQEAHISRVEWSALLYQREAFGKAHEKISGPGGAMIASGTKKEEERNLRSAPLPLSIPTGPQNQGVGTSAIVFRICEAIW
jgi:hypothetical protein